MSSALCQPCDAAKACGVLVQEIVTPSNSLSALIFGVSRTSYLPMECRAGMCVPDFIPQPQAICKLMTADSPADSKADVSRSENGFASRKLQMVSLSRSRPISFQ